VPGRAADFNLEVADIERFAFGKVVVSVLKMGFLAMPDFCVGPSL
jgi:hypothetical protein